MPTPLAELDGIAVRRGGQLLLGPLAAPVETGLTGLIGPSGGGKSTLLRLLAGRLPSPWNQAGALWSRGLRVPPGRPLAGTVLATQDAQSGLDPRARVGSLLRWAAGADGRDRGDRLLRSLDLAPDTLRRTRTTTLSGGMRQRLLLALALLRAERLLLVDEPTSALDAANAERAMDAIERWLAAGPEPRGALVVSHDVDLLCRRADRIWVLDEGRLVEQLPRTGAAPLHRAALRSRAARAHVAALSRLRDPRRTDYRSGGRGPLITFDEVAFCFRSGPPVLRRLSFELDAGETLVISGPSGSGKSTIARLAAGLLAPARGAVRSAGREPRPRPGRRSPIQLVFQDAVDAFNPRRTIGRALDEAGSDRRRQLTALRLLDLDPLLLETRPARLSGGERQRLGIARSLLADPALLVVDEPLAQLDPVAALAVLDALLAAQAERGCALLVLTHGVSWTAALGGARRQLVDGVLAPFRGD